MLRQFVFRALPVHVSVSRLSIDKWEQKMLRQSQIARQRMNIQHGGIPVNYLPRVRAPLFYLQLSVLNLTCPKFLPKCLQHHCIVQLLKVDMRLKLTSPTYPPKKIQNTEFVVEIICPVLSMSRFPQEFPAIVQRCCIVVLAKVHITHQYAMDIGYGVPPQLWMLSTEVICVPSSF